MLTNCEPASRRSRKDEEGRDFQCGCGKRYLSYPALYTHIKTKHDGRQPEGTQKTGNGIAAKRSKGRLEEGTLRAVHGYLEKNDLQLLSELDEKHFGTVPLHARIKKDALPKEMGECYGALLKQQDCKLTPRSSLDLVLTVYLLNVGEYVNDKLFDHYLMFARLVRSCFHDCAEEVYRQCFAAQATPASPAFSLAECRFFPIICDFLLRYYLPTSDYKELNLSLIELMLYDFCRWMLRNALTHVKVQLKKEYRLMVKPTAIARPKCVRQAKGESEEEPKEEEEEDSEEEVEEEDEDEEDKKDGIEVERDNNAEMQEEVHVTAPQ